MLNVDEAGPRGLERVVRVEGDGIVWSCLPCGADNGIRASRCHRCGVTFASTARSVAREETNERAGRGERVAADALRAMAVAGRAGPLAIPLVIATGIVAILRGIVRALLSRG
jgi:hypothetical protein